MLARTVYENNRTPILSNSCKRRKEDAGSLFSHNTGRGVETGFWDIQNQMGLSVQLFLDVFSLGLSSHFASYSISLFHVGFVLFHCRQFLCRIGDMAANSPKHTTSDLLREKRNLTQHLPLQNMPWKAFLGPVQLLCPSLGRRII